MGVVVILLLNVMELVSVGEVLFWIDYLLSSKDCVCCTCISSVHLDASYISLVCVCVCR